MAQVSQTTPDRRLDSWKEIAAFFGRNERTVRRWAKTRGLPVHRIPAAAKGRIFAFESELNQWLATSGEQNPPIDPQAAQVDPAEEQSDRPGFGATRKWLAAFAICAVLAAVVGFRVKHVFAVRALPVSASEIAKPKPANPESSPAEDLYLQGRYYWNRRTPGDLNLALNYFNKAIARDPNYANAYVGLADTYTMLREYSAMPSSEAYPRALAAATKAVQLDDSSPEAHLSLAFVTFYWSWDAVGAEREFKRALALNQNDARAHHWYATFLLASRRLPESIAQIDKAQSLDPASVPILADKADILNVANQSDAAMALLKQIESTEPSFTSAHRYLAEIYLARKSYAEYLREWRQMALLLQDQHEMAVEKAAEDGYSTGGYEGMLKGTLRAQKKLNSEGAVPAYSLAVTYARLGEKQRSLQCLKLAYDAHDSSLLYLSTEPAFGVLRDDPEFKDLVARVSPISRGESLHAENSQSSRTPE
jgi:Tfp pilus assembly protein PilF